MCTQVPEKMIRLSTKIYFVYHATLTQSQMVFMGTIFTKTLQTWLLSKVQSILGKKCQKSRWIKVGFITVMEILRKLYTYMITISINISFYAQTWSVLLKLSPLKIPNEVCQQRFDRRTPPCPLIFSGTTVHIVLKIIDLWTWGKSHQFTLHKNSELKSFQI